MLQTIELNPQNNIPRASVIWLHGLGADGYDFVEIAKMLNLPDDLGIRFVFPHAPIMPVRFAGGEKMRAWFDLVSLEHGSEEDENGMRRSQAEIEQLIEQEIARNISSEKIILVGFSQGGVMALQCGLRCKHKLAGILVLSAWLPLAHTVIAEKSTENFHTPILMLHGTKDALVKMQWATESYNYLKELNYDVQFKSYNMQHTICPDEINTIGLWLRELL